MKILEVKALGIPEIKVIKFARFSDNRGYFSEPFRKSDFENRQEISFFKNLPFVQTNESYSQKNVIRGLHFQWNPYMGKLVRTIRGHMIDIVLDIRKNSPTCGKIIAYDLLSKTDADYGEWIWVPPGFAHGIVMVEESMIEYNCTGEYSPGCEAGISPLAKDIDWSLCDPELKKIFDQIAPAAIISEKDQAGMTLTGWGNDPRSENFVYGKL